MIEYPQQFPEDSLSTVLAFLRGGGDAVTAVNATYDLLGYTLHELVGDGKAPAAGDVPTPEISEEPRTTPVPQEQVRSLRIGVPRGVHFGPVTHLTLADQLESLCKQHSEFREKQGDNPSPAALATANGQWLKLLLPILIQILQSLLA